MRSVKALVLVLAIGAAGCASAPPQPATPPTWSDAIPTVVPVKPVERNVGRVVIHTPQIQDSVSLKGNVVYSGVHFRGYKLYNDRRELLKDCPGHSDRDDALVLEAGRYIVFAVLEHSLLDHRDQTIQFVVAKGETTYVDMTKPPTEPPAPTPAR